MASRTASDAAAELPVARVLPLLGLAHLDRGFDYLVPEADSAAAQPGVRVRIRFGGQLKDAIVLERLATSDHGGSLRFIERVVSADVVYPPQIARLVEDLAQRYAAVRSDVIRSAIPPRHAGAEAADMDTDWEELGKAEEPDLSAWSSYQFGESFVDAIVAGHAARAVWQVTPGEDWAEPLAMLAVKVALGGSGVLIVVPDQRDVDALEARLRCVVAARQITTLTASLGPQARYRRYLSILRGQARIVIGTRSAAFAPVARLGLAVIIHDGDDNLVEPRAPYHHAREVLTARSSIEGCGLIIGGYSRTAEAQLLVNSGWAHDLVAPRDIIRTRSPLIRAAGDSDFAMHRDPRARSSRVPSQAFDAVRGALTRGRPVLVHVPRAGYVPALACGSCRTPARCRACNGPLGIPPSDDGHGGTPTCRWCGRPETHFRCATCGSQALRAVVLGAQRTAEEIGRAFPQVRVVTSNGDRMVDEIPDAACIVVATAGAHPRIAGGGCYGAALILDTWISLGRSDLRATEQAFATWAEVVAHVAPHRDGGEVVIMAPPEAPVVQELIRFDAVGAAQRELAERAEVGFPPTVHMAAVDGARDGLDSFLAVAELPEGSDVLGPVELPAGEKLAGEYDITRHGPAQRLLIRSPLTSRDSLGRALRQALTLKALRKDDLPLRVQVDPINIG
ncbi:primosomal protein N' [Corynebacterium uterequi]|uniref:Probable replication restart protein PriA n=1 Tax=Corynebacterium uterequi TaxID=1072256 RepID=A0A0G3HH04_9CORY|nr:primosomal protein N' [Corynebacterium uterequi]AKK11178.1 replication restart DNA helicase PriA [Corynebacterium uterequi]